VLNRASARGFIELLGVMARSPMWEYYWQTLPEAGAPDGLRRMYRTGAERNLRAKTGTIDHVSALSGYVRARNGERLAFSIISNNVPSTFAAKRVEDAIGARLAGFDRPADQAPARAAAEPQPPVEGAAPLPPPALAPTPAAQPPVSAAPARTHTIGRGETLSHIARRYGVTVGELEQANAGLDARRLRVGQSVRIPGVASASAPPTTATARPAASGARTHTIRSGDTLDAIARRYGTTVSALQRANPGLNARRLVPGRTVRLP
jgi:LysM repeat protein